MSDFNKSISLSDRQLRIMRFIKAYHTEHGVSTTFAEIGDGIATAKSQVWKECQRLKGLRFLTYQDGKPRTIQITPDGEKYLRKAQNEPVA